MTSLVNNIMEEIITDFNPTCNEGNCELTFCKDCGYLSYAEIDQTLKLKPGAITNALKYF